MSITVKGCSEKNYKFEGPYKYESSLQNSSGVYLVLCKSGSNYNIIDVGESATVKSRIENHDRKDCWRKHCTSDNIRFAVHYTPNKQQAGRREIEQDIRCYYDVPCGEQ